MSVDKIIEEFSKQYPYIPLYLLNEIKKYLPAKVSDADVKKVLENLRNEYDDSTIQPNEAIGVITAQSVGAEATQMALNTFHFAGVASQSIQGLPRLIEILDGKKNLEGPMMKLYLNKEDMSEDKLKIVADKIVETKLSDFANNVDIDMEEKVITIDLNTAKLKRLKIDVESLLSYIDKKIRKSVEIVDGKKLVVKDTANASARDLMAKKELALGSIVFGIKGIRDVTLVKENDEFVIMTSGIALKAITNIPEIDKSRIYCNSVFDIFNAYGIEAARNVIIAELHDVVKSQGLSINDRHVLLIADVMTYTGDLKGMTRYGVVGNKQNVLTRASFETSLKHLANGAILNEENELTSITENVMTNQIVRVGTGIPRIAVKNNK